MKDMLKYEIIFRVSLCLTACMRRVISTSDGCETPHNYSFKPKWNWKVIFPSRMLITNFYEIYLFMTSYIVSWNYNALSHWPIGEIGVFNFQRHKVEYNILRYCRAIWKVGYLDRLLCIEKKPCLTSRLRALRFSNPSAILALWEMSRET